MPKKKTEVKEDPQNDGSNEDGEPEAPDVQEDLFDPAEEIAGGDTDTDEADDDYEEEEEEIGIFAGLYQNLFGESWEMWVGAVVLSLLSIMLFLIASPWGSSGGIQAWGNSLYDMLGMEFPESLPDGVTELSLHAYGMLSILMVIGALASALLAKEFAIRVPPPGEIVKGFLGGVIMAIGCVLAMGCTIGNFFTGWAALSAGALIFVIGLIIGVFIAVKYLLWEMENHPTLSGGKSWTYLAAKSKGSSLQPLAGIIVVIIGIAIAFTYDPDDPLEKILMGFVLIGLLIGIVLQRSRFCVVRALREPFISGDAEPAAGLMAGILVGVLGFTVIKITGVGAELMSVSGNFWMPAIIGGVIFGFGMTIAGGCTVGSTWRTGEGQVKNWFAMIGLVLFMPLVAEYIKPGFLDAIPAGAKAHEFLPDRLGYTGAMVVMILILVIWYGFVKWNERTGRFSAF